MRYVLRGEGVVRSLIIGGKGGDVSESSSSLIRAGRVKYLVVFISVFFLLSIVTAERSAVVASAAPVEASASPKGSR